MKQISDRTWQQVLNEAEVWAVRLGSSNISDEEKKCFTKWFLKDGSHQQAFDSLANTLELASAFTFFPEYSSDNNLRHTRKLYQRNKLVRFAN